MDQHPGPHHVLVQTCYSEVWSVGTTNTCGTVCAQGQFNRTSVFDSQFSLVFCLFVCTYHCLQFSTVKHIIIAVNEICCSLILPFNIYPGHLSLLVLPAAFKPNISIYFPEVFFPALSCICPWVRLSLFAPCRRLIFDTHIHRHSQGTYSQGNAQSDSY